MLFKREYEIINFFAVSSPQIHLFGIGRTTSGSHLLQDSATLRLGLPYGLPYVIC